jgi:hypothetical protein
MSNSSHYQESLRQQDKRVWFPAPGKRKRVPLLTCCKQWHCCHGKSHDNDNVPDAHFGL